MTLQELNSNIRMSEELYKNREMLENLRLKAYSVSSPALSGMPHASGVTQKTEMFAIEIADLEARMEYLKKEIAAKQTQITDFCNAIDDLRVRNACRFRYLHCMSWKEVADLMGTYYSESGVKTLVYTYIDSQSS